jgi:hypothetical protein
MDLLTWRNIAALKPVKVRKTSFSVNNGSVPKRKRLGLLIWVFTMGVFFFFNVLFVLHYNFNISLKPNHNSNPNQIKRTLRNATDS